MIEESFVSFDTAKMLKEAGFEAECGFIVDDDGRKLYRPTQALAARWLREVHRFVVDVAYIPPHVGRDVWQYFVGGMDDMVWPGDFETSERTYATYEEAMEAGISFTLKNLISNE